MTHIIHRHKTYSHITLGIFACIATLTSNAQSNTFPAVGNVGINHAAPSTELDIGLKSGRIQFTDTRSALVTDKDNGGAIYFGETVSAGNTIPTAAIETSWGGSCIPQIAIGVTRDGNRRASALFDYNGNTIFYSQNSEIMRITSNKSIGIGINNPKTKLDIGFNNGGRIQFSDTKSALVTGSNNGGAIYFGLGIDNGLNEATGAIESSWGDQLLPQIAIGVVRAQNRRAAALFDYLGNTTFFANGSEKLLIRGDGNVGIGTMVPDYKLTVKGTIRANEIIVDTGWADDVFDSQYTLISLRDTAEYIKTNRHLPNIPSAKQVEAKGVSIGEMQSMLLRKIEELTLHVITQSEQIDALKRENTEIRSQLAGIQH